MSFSFSVIHINRSTRQFLQQDRGFSWSENPEPLCLHLFWKARTSLPLSAWHKPHIYLPGRKKCYHSQQSFSLSWPIVFSALIHLERVVVLQTWSYCRSFCIYSPHWTFPGLGHPHHLWETWFMALGVSNLICMFSNKIVIPDNKCSFICKKYD